MVTVCHSSTLDSRPLDLNSAEQSENVYENKQLSRREVEKSRSREAEPGSQAAGCRRFVTLRLSTLDSRLLDLNRKAAGSQATEVTTFSQDASPVPLYLGVLMKKPPYIVFSPLTPPLLRVMFAGLRSEAGHNQ